MLAYWNENHQRYLRIKASFSSKGYQPEAARELYQRCRMDCERIGLFTEKSNDKKSYIYMKVEVLDHDEPVNWAIGIIDKQLKDKNPDNLDSHWNVSGFNDYL